MSDKAEKRKPIAERIARLAGVSSFKDPRQGGGGIPDLTDLDIAAALGMVRSIMRKQGDAYEIGPEILETHYQGSLRHRGLLRAAYLRACPPKADKGYGAIVTRRMGATLGVRMLAGAAFGRSEQAEYAYLCYTRLETMRTELDAAAGWYLDRLNDAYPAFIEACNVARDHRLEVERGHRMERVDRLLADIAAEGHAMTRVA
jgi:hypothetical protein